MNKVKKVFKYGTGQKVPEGAIYLTSVVQEVESIEGTSPNTSVKQRFVWHYFLVEIEED